MNTRIVASFVAFAAMFVLAFYTLYGYGVRTGPPDDRTNLSMAVGDVNNLLVGSNVLLRGVPVGKVTGIRTAVDEAMVDFYVDNRYQIPVDSEVRLENLSALGEAYIGFLPQADGGPVLQDGQRIETDRIVPPASISELAVSFSRVLNQADPDALKRVVGELNLALPDPKLVLPNIARAAQLFRSTVADFNGRGRDLLDNFQTLLENAGWLGPIVAETAPIVQRVGTSSGQLFAGVEIQRPLGGADISIQVNYLVDRLQRLLDNNGGDLKAIGEAFQPHLQGIAGALMNFDTGQILGHMLESVPADGAVTLHVNVP